MQDINPTLKVYMQPGSDAVGPSGIQQVILAYQKYLPEFGIELVDNENEAEITFGHAGSLVSDVHYFHGLMFSADYDAPNWEQHTNRILAGIARNALEIIVPSQFVANVFERDMRFTPHIIGHGIDHELWTNDFDNEGYVLWNKNRNGEDVCSNETLLAVIMHRHITTGFNMW